MIYDVLIIGAGCTGVMTARLLSTKNCTVAVADAGCDVAMGATCANSAIVHAGYDAKPGTLKAKLNVRGNMLMKDLAKQLGVPLRECGSHVVGFGEGDLKTLRELYDRGVTNGVPDMRIIGQEELRRMEPNISPEATASLWAPSAGITCPYGLTIAAADNAVTNGVHFYFNFKVIGASRAGDVYYISNGTDTIAARYIVNCAGVNSAHVAELLGENDFPITIIPRRGEYIVLDKVCGKMANSTLFVCPSERGKGILVSPTVDGNLLIGPNAYPIPVSKKSPPVRTFSCRTSTPEWRSPPSQVSAQPRISTTSISRIPNSSRTSFTRSAWNPPDSRPLPQRRNTSSVCWKTQVSSSKTVTITSPPDVRTATTSSSTT